MHNIIILEIIKKQTYMLTFSNLKLITVFTNMGSAGYKNIGICLGMKNIE